MITIINKTDYTNPIKAEENKNLGFNHVSENSFNAEKNMWETEMKLEEETTTKFENTDWRDNLLSMQIPAGIDPGEPKTLQIDALKIGDAAQNALEILENSDINDIIEQ